MMKSSPCYAANDKEIAKIIAQAHFRKGQRADDEVLALETADIRQRLATDFKFLTTEEVRYAFEQGVFGRYGEVWGVNICTMVEWLYAYATSRERQRAVEERRLAALPPKSEPTDEEKEAMRRQCAVSKFEEYRDSKTYSDMHGVIYNFLNRRGLVCPTTAEKWEVYNRVLAGELQKREAAAKNRQPQPIGVSLRKLAEGDAAQKSKNYFVVKFFDDLIRNGCDIKDYI